MINYCIKREVIYIETRNFRRCKLLYKEEKCIKTRSVKRGKLQFI